MFRYAIRITDETLPLIVKLNDGVEPEKYNKGDYFIAFAEKIDSEANLIMTRKAFLAHHLEADTKAIFQTLGRL